ncbi:hypothetical protein [Bradyrhizobium sp.]
MKTFDTSGKSATQFIIAAALALPLQKLIASLLANTSAVSKLLLRI